MTIWVKTLSIRTWNDHWSIVSNYALSRYYNLGNIVIMYGSFVLGADVNASIRIFHLSFWEFNSAVFLNETSLAELIKLKGHWTISW